MRRLEQITDNRMQRFNEFAGPASPDSSSLVLAWSFVASFLGGCVHCYPNYTPHAAAFPNV
jgi:hypothetical protein